MKLTNELIKELDITKTDFEKGEICFSFEVPEYFQNTNYIEDEEDFENLPNRNELFKFQGDGWYDDQGIFYGSGDEGVLCTLNIENNEIISAHYSLDEESGDILEENTENAVQLCQDLMLRLRQEELMETK